MDSAAFRFEGEAFSDLIEMAAAWVATLRLVSMHLFVDNEPVGKSGNFPFDVLSTPHRSGRTACRRRSPAAWFRGRPRMT